MHGHESKLMWRFPLSSFRAALRRHKLRGLQGVLQAVDPQAAGIPVSRQQGLRGHQAPPEPVPVLPPAEVPRHGDAE